MIGQLYFKCVHRGAVYTEDGFTYALCNGQAISRSTYATLSTVWSEGSYGSTVDSIHLPNLDNIYVRGLDISRNADPQTLARTALSGTAPSGVVLGSYQFSNLVSHNHASGTLTTSSTGGGGGGATRRRIQLTKATQDTELHSSVKSYTVVSGTTNSTIFEPAHVYCYPYIQVL